MKNTIKLIWHYTVLVVSVFIILVQSISLVNHLTTSDWYNVLIDVVVISLFAYIIWNRFLKSK